MEREGGEGGREDSSGGCYPEQEKDLCEEAVGGKGTGSLEFVVEFAFADKEVG